MNKIIIPVIAGILVLSIGLSQDVYGPEEQPEKLNLGGTAKAVPEWVDNNFRWYGEGLIEQTDLLNSLSFLLDNGVMHLSDKAAEEAKATKKEINNLKQELEETRAAIAIPNLLDARKGANESDAKEEALNHLRKAYDLNTNFETKIVQYDKDHKDWIEVESWSWGESTAGGEYDVQYRESDLNFVDRLNQDQDEQGIIITGGLRGTDEQGIIITGGLTDLEEKGIIIVNNLEGLEEQGIIITGGLRGTDEQGIIITGGLTDHEKNGIVVVDTLTGLEERGIIIINTLTDLEKHGIIVVDSLTGLEERGIIIIDSLTDLEKHGIIVINSQPTTARN